jgi:hypothetical protein
MGSIRQEPSPPPNDLYSALRDITLRPFKTLKPLWSWKAAILSALLHGVTFYISNLRSGHERAAAAMVVETVFAVFASGLMGAVSQRLRASHPVLATASIVCLGLPALMVMAQLGVHHAARTPHVGAGVLVSFCLASVSTAFSWYAMRHGSLLGGADSTTIAHDFANLPGITLSFVTSVPRAVIRHLRSNQGKGKK